MSGFGVSKMDIRTCIGFIKKCKLPERAWIKGFDDTESIFIHIPKSAGMSISFALYGEDPWHHSISDYEPLGRAKLRKYFKFSFVRNPFERIVSTYCYSFLQKEKNPSTSVSFVADYGSLNDFVLDWLTPKNVEGHYFFRPQAHYIKNSDGSIGVDYVGRYETIEEDFRFVSERLGLSVKLPFRNSSKVFDIDRALSVEACERIFSVYRDDFELFSYPRDYI